MRDYSRRQKVRSLTGTEKDYELVLDGRIYLRETTPKGKVKDVDGDIALALLGHVLKEYINDNKGGNCESAQE